ncbi:hypothetical protein vB_AbaP_Acibel007_17 [Acinetobacter phage vB_AbaP_Acibel007]|uniref:Uncharacterized protein n=1 Tax=Acinetobacter phage vB_AbaP_Acibel007 TaxID=1481187 RepID=A0A075DXW3_9CAUD|nr:hypothetical protein vB_AbaP_Acibel007_17 [Acinetobacter phage vB_AbaP_Acibel007]AHY26788.1 hypothetical protein vB_AbaP_Acibel007_17 [Acinetobacter phage vB_AbaP_Acibel007]
MLYSYYLKHMRNLISVSLLRSTNFSDATGDKCGQLGKRVTVWLNTKTYHLHTYLVFPHTQVTPNQLAGLLQGL